MRKTFLALLLTVAAFSFSFAQMTADDVLANYFENTGGLDNWRNLQSMTMAGKMSMQQMEFGGTIYSKPPKMMRVEVDIQGKTLVQAYDGETAWWINPMMGSEEPQKMPNEMKESLEQQTFESPFIDYADKGHSVELLPETEEVEGAETYVIKLTKEDGKVEYHYFDSEYFVPIMTKSEIQSGPAKGQFAETYLSDYQEVDGLMIPFFMETKLAGQSMQKMAFEKITLNDELTDEMFLFPKKEEGEEKK